MATIKAYAKNMYLGSGTKSKIVGTENYVPNHAYLVYDPDGIDNSGDERVIRGGPQAKNSEEFTSTLHVYEGPYQLGHPDFPAGEIPGDDRVSADVANGNPADLDAIWDQMKARADVLEQDGHIYGALTNNCNSAAFDILDHIDEILPPEQKANVGWAGTSPSLMRNGEEVDLPGYDPTFDDGLPTEKEAEKILEAYDNWAFGREVSGSLAALVREMQNAMTRRFANFGDPLILDLGDQGLELSSVTSGNAFFNLEDRGFATKTGWTTGEDGILVQDDGDGRIEGIDELFGSPTQTGFAELAMLDSNVDGKITAADTGWNTLQVWIDADSDAVTDAGELHTLSELGITEIGLTTAQVNQTIQGNQLVETSTFVMNGQARTAGEVLFQFDPANSVYAGPLDEISFDALTLPFLRGYGTVADTPIAATLDPALLAMLQGLQTSATLGNFSAFTAEFKNFLFKWAGVEGVVPGSRNASMWTGADARHLAFMEKYTGLDFEVPGGTDPGGVAQWESVGDAFNHALQQLGTRFIIQSAPALQAVLTYDITADEIVLKTHDAATLDAAAPANAQQEALYWSVLAQAQLENDAAGLELRDHILEELRAAAPALTVGQKEFFNIGIGNHVGAPDAANDNDIVLSKMNHIVRQVAVGMGRGL